jgi:hypothetical protein
VYIKALFISYILIPVAGWLVATISLNTIFESLLDNGFKSFPFLAFFVLLIVLILTHIVMKLFIEWHMALDEARKRPLNARVERARDCIQWVLAKIIVWSPVVWGGLFLGTTFINLNFTFPESLLPILHFSEVALFLAFFISFNISRIYRKMKNKWIKNYIETDFKEYSKHLQD